jgi:hypothetical protein
LISLRSLADVIRAAQDSLKTSKKAKLPACGLPLLSLGHEQLALITLGTLFNMIARSEFDTCLPPGITSIAYEVGQRCRIERLAYLANHRIGSVVAAIRKLTPRPIQFGGVFHLSVEHSLRCRQRVTLLEFLCSPN